MIMMTKIIITVIIISTHERKEDKRKDKNKEKK